MMGYNQHMEISKIRAEILAKFQEYIEPIASAANDRMGRARTPEDAARIYREYMASTAAIRNVFAKMLSELPPEPFLISLGSPLHQHAEPKPDSSHQGE